MGHVLVPGHGVTSMGGSGTRPCECPGLEAELREGISHIPEQSHPFNPRTEAGALWPCAITSPPALKDSSSTNLAGQENHPREVPKPHQLVSREGGEGRIPYRSHKSHPLPGRRCGCCRSDSELPLGSGTPSRGFLFLLCPGGSIIHPQEQEDTAWHVCSGLSERSLSSWH